MAASSLSFMAVPVTSPTSSSQFRKTKINFSSVRCMSSPQDSSTTDATSSKTPAAAPPTPPQMTTPPPPPPAPKVSTNLSDLLAFSGPAPERINGRLAMIGFVSAMAVELSSGQDVFTQISNGGLAAFVATSVVLSAASLVPLLKGVRAESKSNGVMTSEAELLNGRFAMLGLVALALTEFVKGSALV